MDQGTSTILMLVVLFALMYFLMIRPENKRKKKAQEMRDSLKKGDIITTIGGVVGKVVSVTNDTIVVETSEDRVRIEFTKWAVSTVGVQTSDQPAKDGKDTKDKDAKKEEPKAEEKKEKEKLPEDLVDEIPAPEEEPKA